MGERLIKKVGVNDVPSRRTIGRSLNGIQFLNDKKFHPALPLPRLEARIASKSSGQPNSKLQVSVAEGQSTGNKPQSKHQIFRTIYGKQIENKEKNLIRKPQQEVQLTPFSRLKRFKAIRNNNLRKKVLLASTFSEKSIKMSTKIDSNPSSPKISKKREASSSDIANIKEKITKKIKTSEGIDIIEGKVKLNGEKAPKEHNGVKGESDEEENREKVEEGHTNKEVKAANLDEGSLNIGKDSGTGEKDLISSEDVGRRSKKRLCKKSEKDIIRIENEELTTRRNSGLSNGETSPEEEGKETADEEPVPEKEEEMGNEEEKMRRSPRIAMKPVEKRTQEMEDIERKEETKVFRRKEGPPISLQDKHHESLPPSYYRRRIVGRRPMRSFLPVHDVINRKRKGTKFLPEEERMSDKRERRDKEECSDSPFPRYLLSSTPFSRLWGDRSQASDSMLVNYDEKTLQDMDIDVEPIEPQQKPRSQWFCSIM